jgi:Acyl-CoA reductase (LuxC)
VFTRCRCTITTMNLSLQQRISLLLSQQEHVQPWLGTLDQVELERWITHELGSKDALDHWVKLPFHCKSKYCKARPLSPVLHIVSGNSPHAAFQSTFRGLLMGGKQFIKLPQNGIAEWEAWLAQAPDEIQQLISVRYELTDEWLEEAQAVIIFGNQTTIQSLLPRIPPRTKKMLHGQKHSIAVIHEPTEALAKTITPDILKFDQLGCLSIQSIYLGGNEAQQQRFIRALAESFEAYRLQYPQAVLSFHQAHQLENNRQYWHFQSISNARNKVIMSSNYLDWTMILTAETTLQHNPLFGTIFIHPMPESWDQASLGNSYLYVTNIASDTLEDAFLEQFQNLPVQRFCPIGQSQDLSFYGQYPSRACHMADTRRLMGFVHFK